MMENRCIHDDYTSLPAEVPAEVLHPVVFLLQNSQSMKGALLERIIGDMEDCISGMKSNEKLARTTDVCIVSFSDSPEVVSDWCPAKECTPIELAADGTAADLTAALRMGLDKLQERLHSYDVQGITHFVPFLVLATDGHGGDVSEIAREILELEAAKKLRLFVWTDSRFDEQTVNTLRPDGQRVIQFGDGSVKLVFESMRWFTTALPPFPGNCEIAYPHSFISEPPDIDGWFDDETQAYLQDSSERVPERL